VYQFIFIPQGFISRLIVRLLLYYAPITFWKDGILATTKENLILCELSGEQLLIAARSSNLDSCQESFYLLLDNTETLLLEWPYIKINRLINWPPDFVKKSEPRLIPVLEIEECILAGKSEIERDNIPVQISIIAPDISLSYYHGPKLCMNDLQMDQEIAIGGFAKVFKAKYQGTEVAVKNLTEMEQLHNNSIFQTFKDFRKEIIIYQKLKHPNIVELKRMCMKPFCLIMEFCRFGDLYELIHDYNRLIEWRLKLRIAFDMAQGLSFMHSLDPPIIHRDFKSPNVMVSSYDPNFPCAKIIDFGTSKFFTEPLVDKIVDNPLWLAPEVLGSKPYNLTADTYAYGIVLWEIFTRSKIFEEEKFISVIHSLIMEGKKAMM
jgi:hypothetical protein